MANNRKVRKEVVVQESFSNLLTILDVLDRHVAEINDLSVTLSSLYEKLQPIIVPSDCGISSEEVAGYSDRSLIANRIREMTDQISRLNTTATFVTSRIDI